MRAIFLLLAVAFLGGCNSYNLRYKAQPQPQGANLFADSTLLQDSVGISIDTDSRRLQDVFVRKSDGTEVRPVNIVYPGFSKSMAIGTGVGIGTGPVGIGTGIGIPFGPDRPHGLTTATFPTASIGPAPWELHVKVDGIQEVVIPGIGGAATAK